MLGIDELLVLQVEMGAAWRQTKASEYPQDQERNIDSARLLKRLTRDLRALDGSSLHQRLAAVLSDERGLDRPLQEIVSQAIRDVGFRSSPKSGEEFLEELIAALESELNLHTEFLKDEDQPSEVHSTPPLPNLRIPRARL